MRKFNTSSESKYHYLVSNNKFSDFDNLKKYQEASEKISNYILPEISKLKFNSMYKIIIDSITSLFLHDLNKIFKILVDVEYMNNNSLIYDERVTKIERIIFGDVTFNLEDINQSIQIVGKKKNFINKSKSKIKYYLNKTFGIIKRNDFSLHNSNILLDEYLDFNNIQPIKLRIENWNLENKNLTNSFKSITDSILSPINKVISKYQLSKKQNERTIRVILYILNQRIIYAKTRFYDLEYFMQKNNIGNILLGASPFPEGILLNALFKSLNKKVYRFTHGGERAFFSDPLWPDSELMYCDKYFVHSHLEKKLLENRFKLKPQRLKNFKTIEFCKFHSKKHNQIFLNKSIKLKKNITFISGTILGIQAMSLSTVKPPDIFITDYIQWLTNRLYEHGFEVTLKIHPKSLITLSEEFLHGCKCYIESGFFDIMKNKSEILIFDYAGTVFFDSLVSNKGILYLDNGARKFNRSAKNMLQKRCSIIKGFQDKYNRIRFDFDKILQGINDSYDLSNYRSNIYEKF